MKKKRIILHIDMDYFFAQVEERENPHFRGKPVVVGADPKEGKGRGVVSTCNYEARKYGIRSGMPISRAYKLFPEAVFLPVNMHFYEKVSVSIFDIVRKNVGEVELVSLDEAYADITKKAGSYKKAEEIGERIRKMVFRKEKLTCTVGIGENKMMAKIACEEAKPNGIKTVKSTESLKFIEKMKVEKIPGIGPKTREVMEKHLGKKNLKIKDARKIKKEKLVDLFGKRGGDFYNKLRGVDKSSVETERDVKTVGKEHTFQEDTRDPQKITKTFKGLVFSVSKKVERESLSTKGVVVVCRFEDFETHTRQTSFPKGDYDSDFFYKKSVPLLLRFLTESNKKIRLVGFRVITGS